MTARMHDKIAAAQRGIDFHREQLSKLVDETINYSERMTFARAADDLASAIRRLASIENQPRRAG